MEPRSVRYLVERVAGRLVRGSGDWLVTGVCTDSRLVRPGDVFFAIRGARHDGHDYVADAIRMGARAVVVERGVEAIRAGECAVVLVDNTRLALGRLAAGYRSEFDPVVIGVAGSNGKTTVKDVLASVLGVRFRVLASPASYNNDIGVPLTLLQLSAEHQVLVVELGTNHPGELAPLARLVRPRFGILTSIGREHMEFFGDLTGVVREQGMLGELLPEHGVLFVNGDTGFVDEFRQRTRARVVVVGTGVDADWRVTRVRLTGTGVCFGLRCRHGEFCTSYRASLPGKHQAVNCAFALAVAAELGITAQEACIGLARCRPSPMRMQLVEAGEIRILNDAYNANPDSMLAGLRTLVEMPGGGRRIAVLGEMAEQGALAAGVHREVGRAAARLGVGLLIVVGAGARELAAGAREAGLDRVWECADVDGAVSVLKRVVRPGDVVLVKASRVARLERVVDALTGDIPKTVQECCTI